MCVCVCVCGYCFVKKKKKNAGLARRRRLWIRSRSRLSRAVRRSALGSLRRPRRDRRARPRGDRSSCSPRARRRGAPEVFTDLAKRARFCDRKISSSRGKVSGTRYKRGRFSTSLFSTRKRGPRTLEILCEPIVFPQRSPPDIYIYISETRVATFTLGTESADSCRKTQRRASPQRVSARVE